MRRTEHAENEVKAKTSTLEEDELAGRLVDHGATSKAKVLKALEFMIVEAQKLDDGEFRMLDIGKIFIDFCDRVST